MQISVSSTLTVYHDGQFWVGLAEHVEDGRYGAARIVFGAEPSDEEILRFVTSKWAELAFFGDDPAEASKPARNPKRRAREASKALKQPAMGTRAQQVLASQRETMKRESARARSQRRADEAEARFEQRKLKRKQKHRGHRSPCAARLIQKRCWVPLETDIVIYCGVSVYRLSKSYS